jgi:hypothetical protein
MPGPLALTDAQYLAVCQACEPLLPIATPFCAL